MAGWAEMPPQRHRRPQRPRAEPSLHAPDATPEWKPLAENEQEMTIPKSQGITDRDVSMQETNKYHQASDANEPPLAAAGRRPRSRRSLICILSFAPGFHSSGRLLNFSCFWRLISVHWATHFSDASMKNINNGWREETPPGEGGTTSQMIILSQKEKKKRSH